jgi:transcriptional regulator with XRE-family HTH domain
MKTTENERLRLLREESGLKRDELALLSGVGSSTIAQVELDKIPLSDKNEKKLLAILRPNMEFWKTGKCLEDGSDIFECTIEDQMERVEQMLNGNLGNPYKDALIKELKDQVEFYKELLRNITGKKSFLKALEIAGAKIIPFKKVAYSGAKEAA